MMNKKALGGAAIASLLLGLGVLAGSVVGPTQVGAQTDTQTPAAVATATPSAGNPSPGDLPGGRGFGGPRGRGHGDFGPGGGGGGMMGPGGHDGMKGMNATADGATNAISRTTELIQLVKDDLAYAQGKMDTADVQRWINGADTILKSAQDASTAQKYGQAVAYAGAAQDLARLADSVMAQKLGADQLPSYSQRPMHPGKGIMDPATTTITQVQASHMLSRAYNELVMQGAVIKSANNSQATTYLTEAQNAYATAYSAYNSGNYSDAAASARIASQLSHVASSLVRAATAPADANTPVTVPAPNF